MKLIIENQSSAEMSVVLECIADMFEKGRCPSGINGTLSIYLITNSSKKAGGRLAISTSKNEKSEKFVAFDYSV